MEPAATGPLDPHDEVRAQGHAPLHPHEHQHEADDGHEHEHGHEADDGHDHPHPHEHEHGHDHDHPEAGGVRSFLLHLVRPHSHDHADSFDSALESDARGIRALKISLVALGVTAALQAALVLATGSVALLADTLHNVADALTAIPIWIAFILARRAADRRYTFGYGRAEDLAGLVVLAFIAFSAALAAWESIQRLANPSEVRMLPVVALAGLIGFAGNELVARYRIRVGRQIGSAALVADGLHARTDGFTSLGVVAGAIGVALGFWWADPLVGLAISAMILVVLRDAARHVLVRMMDGVDPALVDEVEAILDRVPGVEGIGETRLRWVGHRLRIDAEIVVDRRRSIVEAHEIAEACRHELFHRIPHLDDALIHADPCSHDGTDPHAALGHHAPGQPAATG